ncbi:MAG: hypothetical protein WC761_00480 [Candidatus Paceibacterota bacterium]|jgi:hypothetical protein
MTDKFPILTKEEVKALLEEGSAVAATLKNPPPPGDYKIGYDKRGALTEHICVVCHRCIEVVFSIIWPEHGNKGHWTVEKYRCKSCKLVYDYDDCE